MRHKAKCISCIVNTKTVRYDCAGTFPPTLKMKEPKCYSLLLVEILLCIGWTSYLQVWTPELVLPLAKSFAGTPLWSSSTLRRFPTPGSAARCTDWILKTQQLVTVTQPTPMAIRITCVKEKLQLRLHGPSDTCWQFLFFIFFSLQELYLFICL